MEQLAQIAHQLGIDQTFYYLFGLMFVLHLLISNVYAKPFQKLLIKRRERTEGVKKEAQDLTAQAEEKFAQYKARMKDVNEKARHALRDNEETARREESRLMNDATNKAKDILQNNQKELAAQRQAAVDALSGEISGLASDIATKVMGRSITAR